MIILDSNVWIAFLNTDDSQHKKAIKVFGEINGKKVIMPEYIFLEICTILRLRTNKEVTDSFVRYILSNRDVDVLLSDKNLFGETIRLFLENKKISFIDTSLVALANTYKVISFDKQLVKYLT